MGMRFRPTREEAQPVAVTTRIGEDAAWSLDKWPPTPPLQNLRPPPSDDDSDDDEAGGD